MKKIAVFGGSFNPPAVHHRNIVEKLVHHFDEVIVVPCGPRPDKLSTQMIDSTYKSKMIDITFSDIPGVRVELFDLENNTFTRTHKLDEMFKSDAEVWHIVGSDIIEGGSIKNSIIHKVWENADWVWNNLKFCVIERENYKFNKDDLPPNSIVFNVGNSGASSIIREKIFKGESINGLVTEGVEKYIKKYNIYKK